MKSIPRCQRCLLVSLFALLSGSALGQGDPAREDDRRSAASGAGQADQGLGGSGSEGGFGRLSGQLPEPGEFDFDGLYLILRPETARQLSEETAEQLQQLNELHEQLEDLQQHLLKKKLEYQLAIESRLNAEELRQLTQLRLDRAAEVRDPASRRSLLLSGLTRIQQSKAPVQFLEGVSRTAPLPTETEQDKRPKLIEHLGFRFYEQPLQPPPELTAQILAICLNPENYKPYGGPKFCGGFHPDLCIDAGNGLTSTKLLICFGCQEIILFDAGQSLKFEMESPLMRRLEALAQKLYVHRAAKPAPGR